jgi:hypothetical protein
MKKERHTLTKIKDKLQMNKALISKANKGNTIVITTKKIIIRKSMTSLQITA